MIGSVILTDTKPEEWSKIRRTIHNRILGTMGEFPVHPIPSEPEYKVIERYERNELPHLKISYRVFGDEWNEAVCVLPKELPEEGKAPAVLTIHGTNGKEGKYGVLGFGRPNREYAIELAQRGFITFSPDQFGFGESIRDVKQTELFEQFYKKYSNWSLDGMHLLEQIRALDVLSRLSFVRDGAFGVMGHSLGGRAAIYLTAFDERVKVCVCSTGISPNTSNIYRNIMGARLLSPLLSESAAKNGKVPWDYHEMIALCAPRAVLFLEPFNDPYNPDALKTFECIYSASKVYNLLGVQEKIAVTVHGDGHDTPPALRELAYHWFERFLRAG